MKTNSEVKNKILNLLSDYDFLSKEKIIENLNIPRSRISNQIESLKKFGYKIQFFKNKGYRLITKQDVINPKQFSNDLKTNVIGKDIFYFKSISSTNTYAKEIAYKGLNEGAIVISDIQTHGRGRKNRKWLSHFGGLYFSIVLSPKISPNRGMYVTMVASVSIVQAIKKITDLNPVIKWPNDILINGKKICGILTEFENKNSEIDYVVVGIGINVNNKLDKKIKKTATSISMELGKEISRIKFLKYIIKYFDKNYKKLVLADYYFIRKLWFKYANIIGKAVMIKDYEDTISGIIYDMDDYGNLILKTKTNNYKITSGDIFYL